MAVTHRADQAFIGGLQPRADFSLIRFWRRKMLDKLSNKYLLRCLCALIAIFTLAPGHAGERVMATAGIDHLLYAASDLQRGMDEIETLLGIRPVPGGNHPQYGTHNALLSLGPGMYLEVIARDPGLALPERGALIDIPANEDSRLVGWVYRVEDIQQASVALGDAGFLLGPIESGRRMKPDGGEISWQLTDPYTRPLNGAVPFLIECEAVRKPGTAHTLDEDPKVLALGLRHLGCKFLDLFDGLVGKRDHRASCDPHRVVGGGRRIIAH